MTPKTYVALLRRYVSAIRKIQLLLRHKSLQTTEIYLKGLLTQIVRPK